jgi:hypothetical protein
VVLFYVQLSKYIPASSIQNHFTSIFTNRVLERRHCMPWPHVVWLVDVIVSDEQISFFCLEDVCTIFIKDVDNYLPNYTAHIQEDCKAFAILRAINLKSVFCFVASRLCPKIQDESSDGLGKRPHCRSFRFHIMPQKTANLPS